MNISVEDVQKEILGLLKSKYDLALTDEQYNENFFGHTLQLNARNLIDLISDLEDNFQIKLDESALQSTDVLTVNGLASIFSSL